MKIKKEQIIRLRVQLTDDDFMALQTVIDIFDEIARESTRSKVDIDEVYKQYLSSSVYENCSDNDIESIEPFIGNLRNFLNDLLDKLESDEE